MSDVSKVISEVVVLYANNLRPSLQFKIPSTKKMNVFLMFMSPTMSDQDYTDLYLCSICHFYFFYKLMIQTYSTPGKLDMVHHKYESQTLSNLQIQLCASSLTKLVGPQDVNWYFI